MKIFFSVGWKDTMEKKEMGNENLVESVASRAKSGLTCMLG